MSYEIKTKDLVFNPRTLVDSITGFKHKGMFFPLTEHDVEEIVLRLSNFARSLNPIGLQHYVSDMNLTLMNYLSKLSEKTGKKTVIPISNDRKFLGLVNLEGKLDLISTTYLHPQKDAIIFCIKTNDHEYSNQIRESITKREFN